MITTLEELSLNAWAALQTIIYDGWIVRFANGYTKRANCINPLYPPQLAAEEKIRFCEQLYREKNLPVVFKMTSAVFPSDLDQQLAERGYQKDSLTSVQTLDLESFSAATSSVEISESLSDKWLNQFCKMSFVSTENKSTLRNILNNIIPHHCFVSLQVQGNVVACGLGVLQSGYIGLFDIVTDKDFRKQGYGQQIVESILSWGKEHGARQAYLQVMLNNPPALRLYSKVGFVEKYQYWYRIKA